MESLSYEQLDAFQKIERKWRKQLEQGIFFAEGESVFAVLLRSQIRIFTVLITPELLEKYRSSMEGRELDLWIAEKAFIENTVQRKLNQGVIASGRIPEIPPLETIVNNAACIVALNGIDHAVNVGSILRNCAAFGVSAVVFDQGTVHPYCWRAIKASIGGVFHVPSYSTMDLVSLLKVLQNNNTMLIAADPSGAISIRKLKTARKVCLILGNEHRGISAGVMELQPERVCIPMKSADSLNVAAASAVFLHQISHLTSDGEDG